jgi:hypothetical protein
MSGTKTKPTRWYYVLAIFIPILACGLTAFQVYRSIPKLPGALEAVGINNLTQVVVPGFAEIDFPKAGAYAVYYEYRSAINGVNYFRQKYPPGLKCALKSKATGADIDLAYDYVEGNVFATRNDERVGVLIRSISIEKPGVYIFSCQYRDGRTQPKIVLAVGPNIIYEFFNVAAKPIAATICGGFAFVGSLGISILIISIVAYKRHQSKKILASED